MHYRIILKTGKVDSLNLLLFLPEFPCLVKERWEKKQGKCLKSVKQGETKTRAGIGTTLSVTTHPYNCRSNRNNMKMKKIKKVGINLFQDLKKTGVKEQYVQYIKNRVRQFFGCKTFVLHNSNNICTTGETISVGREYQYREGGLLERAIIEHITFKDFFIELKVFFIKRTGIYIAAKHLCHAVTQACGVFMIRGTIISKNGAGNGMRQIFRVWTISR